MQWITKQSDRGLPLRVSLKDENGDPFPVSSYNITFSMRLKGPKNAKNRIDQSPAAIFSPWAGIVEYVWQEGDLDVPGTWQGEFRATAVGTGVEIRFPRQLSNPYLEIVVLPYVS